MLEHADRYDAVERPCYVAIVLEEELATAPDSFSAARAFDTCNCSVDSVMPVTLAPVISAR